ncbi:uncharacterized protein LOC130980927 [Arachis stenosperma]|uniref:uncharacterized protein LOC130980927 n=1 Tax=Arachis stenosperma TaxID=217475 RepID=UPI0025AC22CB|nr:uncharacterized protein LOC130980927 [Arachis stenosperma]
MTAKNQEASIKNMERQIGQLSKHFATERPSSSLPSDTIPNPKEECKAIQLRSGRTLVSNNDTTRKQVESSKKLTNAEEANDQDMVPNKNTENPKGEEDQPINTHKKEEEAIQGQQKKEKNLTPPLPYPQSWLEKETVLLTEECSALIRKGLPPKLEDPGSFFLPCSIGSLFIDKGMCDLGASINLIPSSLVKKLGIEKVKPIQMSLELVDQSIVHPKGVIENLLVKVNKFIYPADFVILETEEEGNNSIILGRPFLATARAIIDVEQGELTLRMHEESITLKVFPEQTTINTVEQRDEQLGTTDHYTVNQVLSLEHVEIEHQGTKKKLTVRGDKLRHYSYQPP